MTVLYPNLCYNKVFYKGTALFKGYLVSLSRQEHYLKSSFAAILLWYSKD